MANSYELTQLNSYSFEHMVNFLAMKVLGNGITGFATGADGGRDGYLKGKAPYPSTNDSWEGIWYIQSKFHSLNLSGNHQKWLIKEVIKEIRSFSENDNRSLPDIWIIATNIEPSGVPNTGAYDKIKNLVEQFAPNLKFDIWGGRKILDYLSEYPTVSQEYGHFLTPGHILTELYKHLSAESFNQKCLIEHFMVSQFKDLCYTKLEQAGSSDDHKPKIHHLFKDLPIRAHEIDDNFNIMESLVSASCNSQKVSTWLNFGSSWKLWSKNPKRTRVILLKGGPGQGKSTAGQYFAQIQRAAFILSVDAPVVHPPVKEIANELKIQAEKDGFWPLNPRVPIFIELKEYANWYISKSEFKARNLNEYICDKVNLKCSFNIDQNDLRKVLSKSSWFINFDGLDEVPNDLKDEIAKEVTTFSNEFLPTIDSDALILCTTRPQGYSGQFEELDASVCDLLPLPKDVALACAEPVVRFNRSEEDGDTSLEILDAAMSSPQVKEIMTTPLQSHIMAVVVRDGGRPPEKRWELFNNFYNVMKKREGLKNFPDPKIALLLQEKDLLLKAIHDRLGICLHVRAEYSQGAEAALPKEDFRRLAVSTTEMLMDGDTEETVNTLMEATIERLVFVNTPDSTELVRFDIRQLQEFFAAEFIHNEVTDQDLIERLSVIISDAHWREVVHFILSALIHYKKKTALMLVSSLLYELDNDNENHKMKHYNKRAAIGALLVLRLVEEGLLEQDKRTRSLFSKCLSPLWGCSDIEVLSKLTSLQMEQSRSWVLNNMVDAYIDMDYGETLSCPLLFSVMLPEDHNRYYEVYNKLINCPETVWESMISSSGIEFLHTVGSKTQPWFIKAIIELYFSSGTKNEALKSIHNYILRFLGVYSEYINDLDIDEKYKLYLNQFFISSNGNIFEKNKDAQRYCFISTVDYSENWLSSKEFVFGSDLFDGKLYSYPVELFKVTDLYLKDKSPVNFRKVLELISSMNFSYDYIPGSLLCMIPLCFNDYTLEKQIKYLLSLETNDLANYIQDTRYGKNEILPHYRYMLFSGEAFDKDKWLLLCKEHPDMALNVISAPYFERRVIDDAFKEHYDTIVNSLSYIAINYPSVFAPYYFLWEFVFNASSDKGVFVKKLIKDVGFDIKYKPLYQTTFSAIYKLSLPDEKHMLPHLAYALCTSKSQIDKLCKAHDLDFNVGFLEAFGLSFETLYEITADESELKIIRASSLSLLLLHQFNDKNATIENFFSRNIDFLVTSLYSKEVGTLLSSSVYYLLHDVSIISMQLKEFLGTFSYLSRDNPLSRFMINSIYARWRERSNSVVHQSGRLDSWLQS